MWEEIDRFQAVGEDGTVYTVVKRYKPNPAFRRLSGGTSPAGGTTDFVLSDGRDVNQTKEPESFQILDTGEIIRKIR
jgi:hypothetical protein